MICGTILLDKDFQFPNGNISDKLLIHLGDFGTDYLVFTTTSQPGSRQQRKPIPGCLASHTPPTFFLPAGSCWFKTGTWIELDEVHELPTYMHEAKSAAGSLTEMRDVIAPQQMKDIRDCALQSPFIDGYYVDRLRQIRATL